MYEVVIKNLTMDDAENLIAYLNLDYDYDEDLAIEVKEVKTKEGFLNDMEEIHELMDDRFDEEGCADCPGYDVCFTEKEVRKSLKEDKNDESSQNEDTETVSDDEMKNEMIELTEAYAQLTPEERKTAQEFMKYLDYIFNG